MYILQQFSICVILFLLIRFSSQLLEKMSDSLESTIKDIVRQALLGKLPIASSPAAGVELVSNNPEPASATESPLLVNGQTQASSVDSDVPAMSSEPVKDSASKQDTVAKNEPFGESTNQENSSRDTSSDGLVNSELAEKLSWKHKCEIEAVKHNSGEQA